jgi:hypothetical protein
LCVYGSNVATNSNIASGGNPATNSNATDNPQDEVTQSPQIVDPEEEEIKDQVNMDMMESGINNVEVGKGRKLQSEGSSRTFSNKKHIFDKSVGAAYQSKEDLANQYVDKGNLAMNEMRELIHEVENISQHNSSMFIVRDVEKKTFNIAVANEDKLSEIKMKYENISALDKVEFHMNTSDMMYSYYLGLILKNSSLSTYAIKLEEQLRQEKTSNRAWKNQGKRLESEGTHGVKSSLEEKDMLIQRLNKKNKNVCHRESTNSITGFSRTREGDILTRGIEFQGQGITTGTRKSELVTREDRNTKHGCCCTFYCKSWAKH